MERLVQTELLDVLDPACKLATASRADLRRINALMGNAGILFRLLRAVPNASSIRCLVDLGAGDGTFLLQVAHRLNSSPGPWRAVLVDQQTLVDAQTRDGFARIGWSIDVMTADVMDWLSKTSESGDRAMITNLFLHHFAEGRLRELLAAIAARCRVFAACEPRRGKLALWASRVLGALGCNRVTRHDAEASVRAGFTGNELGSRWPSGAGWSLREGRAGLFSHAFLAYRHSS
jgi:hypothetical protein